MHTVFALLAQRKIKHATVLRVCVNLGHAEGTVEPNEVIFRDMRVLHAKLQRLDCMRPSIVQLHVVAS